LDPTTVSELLVANLSSPASYFVYTTSLGYTPLVLGGVAGADARCMSDSAYPGSGIYKALIVDGTTRRACSTANCAGGSAEHMNWVLRPRATYRRLVSRQTIATTMASAGIFVFPLTNSLDSSGLYYAAGFASTADWRTAANTCTGWSSAAGLGELGDQTQVNSAAIFATSAVCTAPENLICVQQWARFHKLSIFLIPLCQTAAIHTLHS